MEIMRQYRILVVDDDRSILKLVKNVLELDAYDVTTLDRIEELELTNFVGYDLILLDVMMEPVNGFELCSYIRPHLSCPIKSYPTKCVSSSSSIRSSVVTS